MLLHKKYFWYDRFQPEISNGDILYSVFSNLRLQICSSPKNSNWKEV